MYTTSNCSYPRAVLASSQCPFLPGYYTQCKCLPQFKFTSCNSPYILGGGSCDGKYAACVCPSQVSLNNSNDRCSKYCNDNGKNICIEKTCTPTANQTGCTNGTQDCNNGCGANTRKCCVACTNTVTSKPANSTYTYSSCYDGTTKQIQTGWYCSSGYHQSGSSCVAHSYSCPSGYSSSSSGMVSPISTSKVCSCGATSGTCYKEGHTHSYSPCPSGYQEIACSSSQVQTATTSKKCSCGATSGTCYACREKTCEEKGQKTCGTNCIEKTECCGGCSSGQECQNGTCVATTRECLYVGDILYHDKTCSGAEDTIDTSKTVIGVVFDVNRKLAIALKRTFLQWSTANMDIPQLTNFTSSSEAIRDYNGKSNTSIIIAHGDSNGYDTPAADYCYNYVTAGTNIGDWYLPAAGELQLIYDNKTTLDTILFKLGEDRLIGESSSTESNYSATQKFPWIVSWWEGNVKWYCNNTKHSHEFIRPVLAFGS